MRLRLHCSVSIATHQIAEWGTCANQLTPRVLHFSALVLLAMTMALDMSFYWMYQEEEYTSIFVGINSSLLELCFFVTIMALLHLPSSECCRRNKAPRENERMALLAASNIQGTNPPSVWNHANVPSHTVFEPPPEMTECVTE